MELDENKIKLDIVGKILHSHGGGDDIILMGDMNGHVGILGEPINKNGELLLSWCETWELNILNQNSDNGWIMWERGDSKSALDMIIANASAAKKMGGVWIDEEGECGIKSDHNLVVATYQSIKNPGDGVSGPIGGNRININNINWEEYRSGLGDGGQMDGLDMEGIYKIISQSRVDAAKKLGGGFKRENHVEQVRKEGRPISLGGMLKLHLPGIKRRKLIRT